MGGVKKFFIFSVRFIRFCFRISLLRSSLYYLKIRMFLLASFREKTLKISNYRVNFLGRGRVDGGGGAFQGFRNSPITPGSFTVSVFKATSLRYVLNVRNQANFYKDLYEVIRAKPWQYLITG